MNKREFQHKVEEVETLITDGKYAEAVDKCDQLNLDLLDQPRVMQTIAKAYEKCRRYGDAEDLLLLAREYAPKSRGVAFHLCSVAIKANELEEAHRYYDEFEKIARYDVQRYVLQYRMAQAENKPASELIEILENYRDEEKDDRWMYELAVLQAANGMKEECEATCDDIDLWFDTGRYVNMARQLKAEINGELYVPEMEPVKAGKPMPDKKLSAGDVPQIPGGPVIGGFVQPTEAEKEILSQQTREIPTMNIARESEEIPPIEFDYSDIAGVIDEVQAEKEAERAAAGEAPEEPFDEERDALEYGDTRVFRVDEQRDDRLPVNTDDNVPEEILPEVAELPESGEEVRAASEIAASLNPARETVMAMLREKEARMAEENKRRIIFADDLVYDSGEKPAEEAEEENAEENVEETAEETVDETVDEAVEDTVEEAAEEAVEEPAEETIEESVEEVIEDTAEEHIEETSAEAVEDIPAKPEEEAAPEEEIPDEVDAFFAVPEFPDLDDLPEEVIVTETDIPTEEAPIAEETAEEPENAVEAEDAEDAAAAEEAAPIEEADAETTPVEEELPADEPYEEELPDDEPYEASDEAESPAEEADEEAETDDEPSEYDEPVEMTEDAYAALFTELEAYAEDEELREDDEDLYAQYGDPYAEDEDFTEESDEEDEPAVENESAAENEPAEEPQEAAQPQGAGAEEHVLFRVERNPETAVSPDTGMLPITEEEDTRDFANPIYIDFPDEVMPVKESQEEELPDSAARVKEVDAADEFRMPAAETPLPEADAADAAKEPEKAASAEAEEDADAEENAEDLYAEDDVEQIANRIAQRKREQQLFGNLPLDPPVDEKLWHFVVYGETNTLALDCAREHMKEISDLVPNCPGRMLKISSDKIGSANIVNSIDRFLGNMVVVEQAASLSDEQLADFAKILDRDDRSLLVVFTDTREDMIGMFQRVPALAESFTAVFEGKILNARDLVNIGKEYLYSQGARLSREASDVLYEKARELLGAKQGYYKSDICEYCEIALGYAEKAGFLGFAGAKIDKEGYLIITEKHLRKADRA